MPFNTPTHTPALAPVCQSEALQFRHTGGRTFDFGLIRT